MGLGRSKRKKEGELALGRWHEKANLMELGLGF
uniref:Uncharacterized protein n=1 Tax=Arundo donax TaxID=35708 RepID=A0A0A9CGA4_ARUDO